MPISIENKWLKTVKLVIIMNRIITIFCLLLITSIAAGQHILEIEITGIRNNKGEILLQLFDEDQKVIDQQKSIVENNKCKIKCSNLKPGKYAFRFFHDENLSGIMETNEIGIPKEGYGFSNNGAGLFGPKPFKFWLFDFKTDKKIVAKIRY
jgi:uncharacterized protein (DUF2141 family)